MNSNLGEKLTYYVKVINTTHGSHSVFEYSFKDFGIYSWTFNEQVCVLFSIVKLLKLK